MNKFRGPEDANYRLVKNVIKEFVEKASEVVSSRRKCRGFFLFYLFRDISD